MIANATYSPGMQAEARVKVHGHRNGFAYIEFADGRVTKVPESWVTEDATDCVCEHCKEKGSCFGCTSGLCP